MMENQLFDVIVVGGGAVGLFLACECRLAGLSVLVVERFAATAPRSETRAPLLHGRTCEIMAMRGILNRFLEDGEKNDWWHFGFLETRINYKAFQDETKQNYVLMLPQCITEDVIQKRAQELGVHMVFGVTVQSLEQSPTSVTIHGILTGNRAGLEEPFSAVGKYLVGTDGTRSIVRASAGIDFPGSPATHTMISAEVKVGIELPNPFMVHSRKGFALSLIMKVRSGRSRVVAFTSDQASKPASDTVMLEQLAEALMEVTGLDFELSDPSYIARFSNEARLASHYRKGRVFLAGDAAHQHLPASGQGLNLGLQDSLNLSWKLAAVLKGSAPESLLDTYQQERMPVAEGVIANTTAQSLLLFADTEPQWKIRQTMNKVLDIPEANRAIGFEVSAFEVSYPNPLDMISLEGAGWESLPECLSGTRALNVTLRVRGGEERELFDYFHEAKWVQLRFPEAFSSSPPARGSQTVLVDVVDIVAGKADMYRCGFAALLIRPDGYLAFGKK
jgi:2-polyprenyl-6-methoxyphenol hydroxylase-like FAD-dependent oxidoreductase